MGDLADEVVQPKEAFGWAARDTSGVLSPFTFSRRATGEKNVSFKVLYCEYAIQMFTCLKTIGAFLPTLLFPDDLKQGGGDSFVGDSFVGEGFTNWKNQASLLEKHDNSTAHQQASRKCLDLMNQNQHIETTINKQTNQARIEYRTRLGASIDCS
ncbi:hypothetical protein LWI29_003948 [Acer saccharum]|uniref:DUF4371 domain-containing protein n=1 Tax=Acer saccharum TaxID=4024 RepID=A0AA39W5S3_ACESA|nr:hypothetical protein LWI29_003948 [Acer saccharum]